MPIEIRQPSDAERASASAWAIWTCDVSSFEWGYAQTETCLILEGEAMVEARGKEFHVRAGDWAVFPIGLACRWNVTKAIRKHYRFD